MKGGKFEGVDMGELKVPDVGVTGGFREGGMREVLCLGVEVRLKEE